MTATTPDPLIPPLVAQAIELARRRDFSGSCSLEVGRLLRVLASQHRRGTVAEIGTGCGVGAAWIIAGLASTAEFVTVELEVARAGAVAQLFSGYSNVTILPGDWTRLRDRAPFVMLFADAVAPSKPAWLPAPELGTG